MPESGGQRRRVFFALWPSSATLESLEQIAIRLHAIGGGRRTRRENLHITLAFIGEVPDERVAVLRQAATQVVASAFLMRLDHLDCWRRKRMAWVGCSRPPLQLLTLVGQLYEHLAGIGLPLEIGAYTAHVTLLRNVHCARCTPFPEIQPMDWAVDEFVLAESRLTPDGPHYAAIGRWRLTGTTGQSAGDGDPNAGGFKVPAAM